MRIDSRVIDLSTKNKMQTPVQRARVATIGELEGKFRGLRST